MELQAHGRTSDRNAPESFEQDADDVAALLQQLNIKQASFLVLAWRQYGDADRHKAPQLVKKLIIASAFYKREGMVKGFFEGLEKATFNDMPQHLKEAFLKVNNDSTALLKMFEKDKARMVQFKDWPDADLISIKAPSLILLGDKDVVTTEHAIEMSRKIPNSRIMILPADHGSYMGEGMSANSGSKIPSLTVGVIEEFLNE